MNTERVKPVCRHFYIFLPDDMVMLVHFQFAGLSVEIPASTLLKRDGDHRLWRIKLYQLAVQINPRPAKNAVFIRGEKVGVGDHTGPVHFELEKILPIDVLRPTNAIQNLQANLPICVRFGVGNIKTIADFFDHVVSPAGSIRSWNQGSGQCCCHRYEQEYRQCAQSVRAQRQCGSDRSRPTKAIEWIRLSLTTASA